jgi:hypothetical protein
MTALLRRVWRAAGAPLVVAVPVFLSWSAYLVATGSWRAWVRDLGGVTGLMGVALLLALVAVLTGDRRPAVVLDHRDTVRHLARSTEEYCLVLRPRGGETHGVVPDELRGRRVHPDLTLEQVVALAARAALGHPTYALVDGAGSLAPPGPTYVHVPDPERRAVARRLIGRAHSIVLVLPATPEACSGFAGEVEEIVRAGVAHRVIIVLPPPGRDARGHHAALQRAALLLAALRGAGRPDDVDPLTVYEYELALVPSTVVLKCTRGRQVHAWSMPPTEPPRRGRARQVVAAASYVPAVAEAITDTEQELLGLGFGGRYPRARNG